ncbi:MAG: putative 2-aminoethylphosphonate ABC transporter ATP-binding protein [Desulfovibrio sp.]|nr:MAG: putative 2-aminoethylphosphonate ABC transporter ATP-binding protein [Desulfovibrio sp.]
MSPAEQPHLEVVNVSKLFGTVTALDKVSFTASQGEFLSILGPSGCGKTTILRVVAGLEPQTSGSVSINGQDVSRLPVSKRNIGIVFQSYALFPNLTATKNVAYGLKSKGMDKKDLRKKVEDLMDLVGLSGMGEKYPSQLSGGQQQRVALARAMALSPNLLLLDEPLSALDAKVRIKLRSEIRDLQRRLGVTTIMVTHDQEEALTMADRILVMDQGELVQFGAPHEIYDFPSTPFVASFIGSMNFIRGAVKAEENRFKLGESLIHAGEANKVSNGAEALMAIRPEDVLVNANGQSGPNTFQAKVLHMEYKGSNFRVRFQPTQMDTNPIIEAEIATEKIRRLDIREGQLTDIDLPVDRIRVYESQGSQAHA